MLNFVRQKNSIINQPLARIDVVLTRQAASRDGLWMEHKPEFSAPPIRCTRKELESIFLFTPFNYLQKDNHMHRERNLVPCIYKVPNENNKFPKIKKDCLQCARKLIINEPSALFQNSQTECIHCFKRYRSVQKSKILTSHDIGCSTGIIARSSFNASLIRLTVLYGVFIFYATKIRGLIFEI
jgi:hypothetical protein